MEEQQPGRIAKWIAHSGLCSRRDAELWIKQGRVSLNGKVLETAAHVVSSKDLILVDGNPLSRPTRLRLWKMHKPVGVLVSDFDSFGRRLLKDLLPPDLPRLLTVGRLDMNSEGLILLTTDGALKQSLESPARGIPRTYKVRVFGRLNEKALQALKKGPVIDGIAYGPVEAEIIEKKAANSWISIRIYEGKNREIRHICNHMGLQVSRLIRIAYGQVKLGNLHKGAIEEVGQKEIYEAFGVGTRPKKTWAKAKRPQKKPVSFVKKQQASRGAGKKDRAVFSPNRARV